MIVSDKNIKKMQLDINNRVFTMKEKDQIDFVYKDTNGIKYSVYGFILKIGIDPETKREYLTVLDYKYSKDNNIHFVPVKNIVSINNIKGSTEPYSFSPIYCADESIILFRNNSGKIEFTNDGRNWSPLKPSETPLDPSKDTGLYQKLKEKGFKGSIDEMADKLIELLENVDDIVVRKVEEL